MKKFIPFLSLFLLILLTGNRITAQQFILYTENFEGVGSSFTMNSGGPAAALGNNKWIINNSFSGTPTYANTLRQDSTVSGTIGGAPFSKYMHIHDEPVRLGGGVSNANYNGNSVSDNFAYISSGFCTKGMTDVIFTFFYLGEGSPDAYGEIYYSIEGGPWIGMGTHYSNQHRWKYETISDPSWANKNDVRIGFRWVNGSSGSTTNSSWGLDDFVAVGTYDSINFPVRMTITSVSPNPVCQLSYLFINWQMTHPLCFGEYRIEISNASGVFGTPATSLGTYYVSSMDSSGVMAVQIPGTIAPGLCYRVRITRMSPAPPIQSTVSACFEVRDCPNTITTLTPIVLTDRDTCCVRSAIDVPFYSVGVFNPGNTYIAEISDASGSFAAPRVVGTLPSTTTYDPALGSPPGNVSGLIPNVPAGCGYYIRVRGTNPPTVGTTYGPFCLKHCDITTNATIDMQFCISDTAGGGVCDSIEYNIHSFDSLSHYFRGNNFRLQIINKKTFAIVNDGTFYFHYDTASRQLVICIPYLDSLVLRGLAPGSYYARFVADSSSDTDNINGTIIRFTIGAPASNPPRILVDDTVGCNVGVIQFLINPYNMESQYEWRSDAINFGTPFMWPYNPLRVDFTGARVDDYTFRVREQNYGCYGPLSAPVRIYIIGTPPVTISGPDEACLGDTVCFEVPYIQETYYEWTVEGGTIIDASNNQMCVAFDSLGSHTVSIYALNDCGTNRNSKTVTVKKLLDLNLGADKTICAGEQVRINASNTGVNKSLTTTFGGASSTLGNMFTVKALYDLTIVNFDCNFQTTAPVDVQIYYKDGDFSGFETDPTAWTLVTSYVGIIPAGPGLPTRIPVDVYMPLTAGNTYSFYFTTSNGRNMLTTAGTVRGALYATDGILEVYEGTKNVYLFGAFTDPYIWNGRINYNTSGGLRYQWNTGDTTQAINVAPLHDSTYEVRIYDTSGCGTKASVNVLVNDLPMVNAGPDTFICFGQPFTMMATSSTSQVSWSPATGLSNPNIVNPTIVLTENNSYVITTTDPSTNCKGTDTVKLMIKDCQDPLKVPEAFSPNGDGVNDHFTVFAEEMKSYEIRIFNRWGEEVYHSEDAGELNDLNKGWDGTFKGKVQDIGVYVYYIKGVDRDNITREKKGNLTLVK